MNVTQAGSSDVYGRTHQMDERTLEAMAARLEARGRHPVFVRAIDDYMTALDLSGDETLLELGCGTGVATRMIAARPVPPRRIVALDLSPYLVEAARRLCSAEGLDGRIDWRVGDAHALSLDERGFDIVLLHTLISHVTDPIAVLDQAIAFLRQGTGRVVLFDVDVASLSLATDAEDGGAATDQLVRRGLFAQPRVMRAMPRLLAERGYSVAWSRPYAVADIGRADYFAPMLASLPVLLPKSGVMSEAEAQDFVDGLGRIAARNCFFGTITFHAVIALPDG
jgi:ubiquinone/menaquinone biosynthesis C-methylase UbiE